MDATQPASQQKVFVWPKRLLMILIICVFILILCSAIFWMTLRSRYFDMQPIASHTYSWFDFSGEEMLNLGDLQAEELISLTVAVEQGEVKLHAENDAGDNIQLYENPFEKGACPMVVPTDGSYCLQFSAEDSCFTITATVLHEEQ